MSPLSLNRTESSKLARCTRNVMATSSGERGTRWQAMGQGSMAVVLRKGCLPAASVHQMANRRHFLRHQPAPGVASDVCGVAGPRRLPWGRVGDSVRYEKPPLATQPTTDLVVGSALPAHIARAAPDGARQVWS